MTIVSDNKCYERRVIHIERLMLNYDIRVVLNVFRNLMGGQH